MGITSPPDTIYPTLHHPEKGGYLVSIPKVVEGKVRRYYQATSEGKRVLEQSKKKIRELVTEVIEERWLIEPLNTSQTTKGSGVRMLRQHTTEVRG